MEHRFFESIPLQLPVDKIYARLGYANGKTVISPTQQRTVDDYITQAKALLQLQGAACRMHVMSWGQDKVILEGNLVFQSIELLKSLRGAADILLMGATAGNKIYDFIKVNSNAGDNTASVVFDAVASEAVDACMKWIADFYKNLVRREGNSITLARFSCGYGDFALSNQKIIYEKLQLNRFGVEITPAYILKPEKSVTALIGIKKI